MKSLSMRSACLGFLACLTAAWVGLPTFSLERADQTFLKTQSELGWTNVKHPPFNAVGDGVTNDTAAFASAIAAIGQAGRGKLYIPPGQYLIGQNLVLPSNVEVQGAGKAVTKLIGLQASNIHLLVGQSVHHLTIRDLSLIGNGVTQANGVGINLANVSDFLVTNVDLLEWRNTAIQIVNCTRGIVSANNIDFTGDHGLSLLYSSVITVDSNGLNRNLGAGIEIGHSSLITVQANTLTYEFPGVPHTSGRGGLDVYATSDIAFVGNTVRGYSFGIQVGLFCKSNTLSGNTIIFSEYAGIVVQSPYTVLSANTVRDPGMAGNPNAELRSGVWIRAPFTLCGDSVITDQRTPPVLSHGVYVDTGIGNNSVTSTVVSRATSLPAIRLSGSGNIEANNLVQ